MAPSISPNRRAEAPRVASDSKELRASREALSFLRIEQTIDLSAARLREGHASFREVQAPLWQLPGDYLL
jgi:hypothetical protein